MVELKLRDGTSIFIAPHHVLAVWEDVPKHTVIQMLAKQFFHVRGTPTDVVAALHYTKTDPAKAYRNGSTRYARSDSNRDSTGFKPAASAN